MGQNGIRHRSPLTNGQYLFLEDQPVSREAPLICLI
jgi:hypothetical protein